VGVVGAQLLYEKYEAGHALRQPVIGPTYGHQNFIAVLQIRDVYPGSQILIFSIPDPVSDPGSRISDPGSQPHSF
jgi:hypothetical protein